MSDQESIDAAKRDMRRAVRADLAGMSNQDRRTAASRACERIVDMPEFRSASMVMLYLPLPGELDCTAAIERALESGKAACVPNVDWDSHAMQPIRLTSIAADALVVDRHGVRVPKSAESLSINILDLVIVPGLAFDERGHRLGRGGGFYDRFLKQLPGSVPVIGLAFERQIVPRIPREKHDAAVRIIVTEERLIRCE